MHLCFRLKSPTHRERGKKKEFSFGVKYTWFW